MSRARTGSTRRVVYITYDGLEDPLGQSQVRPYINGLASRGHRFEILSFEKPGVPTRFRQPAGGGVRWTALRYHKRPTLPATAFDVLQGLAATALTQVVHGADLLHARSYVAAAIALPWARTARVPLLFDMRGLWPDEKVEGGVWSSGGRLYRDAKRAERRLLRNADVVTVLTHAMQGYLRNEWPHRAEIRAPIHVIPTCTDLTRFSPAIDPHRGLAAELQGARILTYVGSLGARYMDEAMARFYLAWRRAIRAAGERQRATRFLIISRSAPGAIATVLESGGASGELVYHQASYDEVPAAVRCAEAAVCFVRPSFSSRGSVPTKFGEMLACGIPVAITNIGDVARLHDSAAVVVVDDMSSEGLASAAQHLIEAGSRQDVRHDARRLAERWFSLEDGVDAYDRIYRLIPDIHRGSSPPKDEGWPLSQEHR